MRAYTKDMSSGELKTVMFLFPFPAGLASLIAGAVAIGSAFAEPLVLHVSLDGHDTWSGRLAEPNPERSDGPFATLTRARDELRRVRTSGQLESTHVYLHGGIHFLDAPLIFLPQDSGSAAAPIVYEAYRDEKPVLSGGRRLTGWEVKEGKWQVTLPEVQARQWDFVQLFVADERRPRPRLPRKGWFHIEAELPRTTDTPGKGDNRFQFRAGDLLGTWSNPQDVEILAIHLWSMSRMRVKQIDDTGHAVTFTGSTPSTDGWAKFSSGRRFLVENVREALDEPGQWYLDHASGLLTYLPRQGEDPATVLVIAPRIDQLLVFRGDASTNAWVHDITFRGIAFAHTNWVTPLEGNSLSQAEATISGAISAMGLQHCTFDKCDITLTGGYAMELGDHCRFNRIENCELIDLGAGGIKIGSPRSPDRATPGESSAARDNVIRDCLIEGGGRLHPAAVGIWIGHSSGNTIEHNDIVDFYYTGISVGWSWGYEPSSAQNNAIAWNRIARIGQKILSDMGGIYTLGNGPGNVLDHNVISDVAAAEYGGWGIYFDEGSSGFVATNNIVYQVTTAGFHQHYGRENIVRNNIFALGRDAQLMRSRDEPHLSFTLERNIIYSAGSPIFAGEWSGNHFRLEHNLYWRSDDSMSLFPGGRTLEAWQKETGHDLRSIIADPLFIDPKSGDFRLKPGSPAERIDFQPIEPFSAGRKSPRRHTIRPVEASFLAE